MLSEGRSATRHASLSEEVVEANVLESDVGMGVVLLNWTDVPIGSLTVTVPITSRMAQAIEKDKLSVRTATGKSVLYFATETTLTASMPLESADVLILSYDTPVVRQGTVLFVR